MAGLARCLVALPLARAVAPSYGLDAGCRSMLCYLPQRFAAAFFAISLRLLAVMPTARALPPIRPSATAAAFLPYSVAIWAALPLTSAGAFRLLVL